MINISKLLWRSKEFFLFFISATTIYKIHAPFAFRLIQRVFEDHSNYYAFSIIELQRNKLGKSKEKIDKLEFGEGSGSPTRDISKLAKIDSSPPDKGQLLFKLINHLQAREILELGTCIGIGTSYLGFANQSARVHSVEACPNTLAIARNNILEHGLKNIKLSHSTFDEYIDKLGSTKLKFDLIYIDGHHNEQATIKYFERLKPFMNEENCTVVFDDIYWSKGMKNAWEELKKGDSFKLNIDLFHIGILFRNKNLRSKASYKLVKSIWKPWISGFFTAKTN